MTHAFKCHYFHLIWSTKKREKMILPIFRDKLYAYMGGIIRKKGAHLLQIGGIEDHVHLLVSIGNLDNFSDIIRDVKTGASRWIHQEFPEYKSFGWQEGCGSYTVSYSNVQGVKKYIMNQEKHHKTQTFEEEYISFLKMQGIPFDPRFVFD